MDVPPSHSRRRGIGCLPGLFILVVLGPLLVMTIDLIFAPWIYTVEIKHGCYRCGLASVMVGSLIDDSQRIVAALDELLTPAWK